MTDDEIGEEFKTCARKLCTILNKAGAVGLQIDVKFVPSQREDGPSGELKLTNWHSRSTLSRVTLV
jgi:hypothetical protein